MTSSAALPATLRSVTSTKIQELKRQREQYEAGKTQILHDAKSCESDLKRAKILLHGACRQAGIPIIKDDASSSENLGSSDVSYKRRNQHLLLRQAEKDPAFAPSLVRGVHQDLLEHLDLKSVRHQHAQFFSQLVTEWISGSQGPNLSQSVANATENSAFESVGRKEMHEQRAQWESIVFGSSNVDQSKVKKYLHGIFETDGDAYKNIAKSTASACVSLWYNVTIFHSAYLKTVIKGLLQTDLLSAEKADILKSFRSNKISFKRLLMCST